MTEQKCAMITGVTGQDGSYLAELLLDKGYEVVGLSRRTTNHQHENISHLGGRIAVEYGDLLDGPSIERVIADWQPDEVYNLAAMSVPADSWKQPVVTAEITAVGTMRVLEAVRRCCPTARFYQATSREIYGGIETEVIDEAAPYRANNPYGIAKLYAHLMTETYRESYGMFTCGGILFNHESPRRSLHFVTRKVTMAVAYIKTGHPSPPFDEAGRPLVLEGKLRLGNLDAVRDWGYAPEFVEAMWLMLQTDEPQSYIIATNTSHTIRELCEVAFSRVGLNWEEHVETDELMLRPTEITASRGDYSKARAELGWEPRTQFKEIIERMVDADMERLQ
ncbi:MAG TPA: GDP-mannose 4,6-dehydratase [Candidatus Handelsmanbacteria bacterium]|nr:GDP-mannose 4,6-dehydratase [Candidatus Handelsmanbacteria bacterium]